MGGAFFLTVRLFGFRAGKGDIGFFCVTGFFAFPPVVASSISGKYPNRVVQIDVFVVSRCKDDTITEICQPDTQGAFIRSRRWD